MKLLDLGDALYNFLVSGFAEARSLVIADLFGSGPITLDLTEATLKSPLALAVLTAAEAGLPEVLGFLDGAVLPPTLTSASLLRPRRRASSISGLTLYPPLVCDLT